MKLTTILDQMRTQILHHLQVKLASDSRVYAMWLEGSDGTGTSDEYSDLDINVDVEDNHELAVLGNIQQILAELGPLDSISVITQPNEHLWFQVFHIQGTSKYLLIDVNIQRHSRNFSFCRQNTAETPVVIFDKTGVIQFHDIDQRTLHQQLNRELETYRTRIQQSSRVEKYLNRGHFLEALVYYQKYILESVTGMARIIHTPLNTDYHLVRISKQLPLDILKQLEYLYQIGSLADIETKLPLAIKLFHELEAQNRD